MSKIRQRRTAEQIQFFLSDLVLRGLKDPRLQGLTITEVKVDRELQYANIYVNALGDESRRREVMASLSNASGYLRRELSSRMRIRSVPNLQFHWDPTLAHAEEMNQLLDDLNILPESDDVPDESTGQED